MFLTLKILCFVHGQIYQNFLKSRTMSYPFYNTIPTTKCRLLLVKINVNTIYRCFLADATRRTTHLPGRLNWFESRKKRSASITVTHLAVAMRVYCSFVDPGQNGGGGTDRKRKADALQRTRHWSGRLLGSSLCCFP